MIAYIDIIERGRALIMIGNRSAFVGRDGGRYYIDDEDTGETIGYASSYEAAARRFARHHGVSIARIEKDKEY